MKLTNLVVLLAIAMPLTAAAETHGSKPAQKRVAVTKVTSFDYGKLYVHTPERQELQRVAQLWRQRPAWWTVTVEGHGYIANDEEASIELGEKRAKRVPSTRASSSRLATRAQSPDASSTCSSTPAPAASARSRRRDRGPEPYPSGSSRPPVRERP
jgi:outer membrane protein OmpA-like peptidoglycan-associated protein